MHILWYDGMQTEEHIN